MIQQLGRGMRIAEGKEYCLYLDHAGNMAGWYADVSDIWANGVSELPSEKKEKPQRKEGKERESTVCHECRFVMSPQATECLHCGAAKPGPEVAGQDRAGAYGGSEAAWGKADLATNRRPMGPAMPRCRGPEGRGRGGRPQVRGGPVQEHDGAVALPRVGAGAC